MRHMTRLVLPAVSLMVVILGFQSTTFAASEAPGAQSSIPETELPKAEDLSALAETARKQHLPILLMYSAEDCDYCQQLEADVLRPMMISGELTQKVIFRIVQVDDMAMIKDFHGKSVDPEKFAFSRGVQVTPTLQFLDSQGDELEPKIIGYRGSDLFNAYLDAAISGSQEKLAKLAKR